MLPSRVTLLCLPCAGASAAMYLRWRRLLPAWIDLVAVELPGRGARMDELYIEDIDRLTERLCTEHTPALRGRYALFGHSMGALLAYRMALRQRALGRDAACALFASASAGPSRRDPDRFAGEDDDAALIVDLHAQGGTPQAVFDSPELLRLTLDTLRADYRVCDSFRDTRPAPLDVPLHVFAGRNDDIAKESIEAWRREAGAEFSLHWFDGGHFFIRRYEHEAVAAIARMLAQSSAATASPSPVPVDRGHATTGGASLPRA
ncbi:thioesterase II family protein [Arhodomonas sp. AD133]|uniref:thioesterase II family protein n=1 Tax=Arhodomonas sp. AD133 TaxID=3415009 RepID=UPI003EBBA11B